MKETTLYKLRLRFYLLVCIYVFTNMNNYETVEMDF